MNTQVTTDRSGARELPDDPRLLEAVQEYLAELEAGRHPNRQEFLGRYADLAPALEECVEGLELVHRAAAAEKPAVVASTPHDVNLANPLGDFQIIREVGRGGMGIVYEAVQLSLGRRVALKVLPFAATFDSQHLQRFRNEAQAAAHLHHTNIVPVYAVGCERGMHFYAMQLIDGQSLAAVIRDMRLQAGRPVDDVEISTPLGGSSVSRPPEAATPTKLSLTMSTQRSTRPRDFFRTAAHQIVQAAQALQHAHEFGIVHRDIKPANLLVDVHGRLWITDFGLAQFHADARVTRTGDIVGTLRYMSPEQAAGKRFQVDQRTDVYSLGATLYELTTLEPVCSGNTYQELLQQIARDEPRAPRSIDKYLPIELETIILKALSKRPADRYSSAQDFAADLQRFLDDKPILAKRPTLLDRARKWSRRHPSAVAGGMLLLLVCIIGLLVNNRMIALEQARTESALASERQRAAEARLAVGLLVDVSEQVLADHPHLQGVRKRLLETALGYYQNFIEGHSHDANSKAELQAGKSRVSRILDELSTLEGANLLGLTRDKIVQADLKLTDDQLEKLLELNKRSTHERLLQFRDQRTLTSEKRRQVFYELAKSQELSMSEILQPEQLRRLRQIELQTQGPRAFHESQAVQLLKLTPEQKRRIREFKAETLASIMEPGDLESLEAGNRPVNFSGRFEQVMKFEVERVLALLSPAQLQQWREMIGVPIEGVKRMPPGGFGPPRLPFGPP